MGLIGLIDLMNLVYREKMVNLVNLYGRGGLKVLVKLADRVMRVDRLKHGMTALQL